MYKRAKASEQGYHFPVIIYRTRMANVGREALIELLYREEVALYPGLLSRKKLREEAWV